MVFTEVPAIVTTSQKANQADGAVFSSLNFCVRRHKAQRKQGARGVCFP